MTAGPAAFFVAYVAAIVIGLISHSPGGLGAFEAALLAGLGLAGRPDVLAALILYRLVYYLVPFALAATGVIVVWSWSHRHTSRRRLLQFSAATAPLIPSIAGGLALISGVILLFSGALPSLHNRTVALETVTPLAIVETSHLVGSAVGAVLSCWRVASSPGRHAPGA